MNLETLAAKIDSLHAQITQRSAFDQQRSESIDKRLEHIEEKLDRKVDKEDVDDLEKKVQSHEVDLQRGKGVLAFLTFLWTGFVIWIKLRH